MNIRRILDHPLLLLAARLILAGIFLYACYDKILDPKGFAVAIKAYQIVTDPVLVNLSAIILPWLELVLGVLLVANIWTPGALLLVTGLIGVFWAALTSAMLRGLDIHCGCFAVAEASTPPDMIWYMWRDAMYMALSLFAFIQTIRMKSQPKLRLSR